MTDEGARARFKRLERLRAAVPKRLARFERIPTELTMPKPPPAHPLEEVIPGREVQTDLGPCYLASDYFDTGHQHGDDALGCLTGRALGPAATFAGEPRLGDLRAEDCVFLDTETTGLSLGAGTLVFLVGVGWLTDSGVEVQQFLLRDPGEEPAMLTALAEAMQGKAALVTFNGRVFDVPLLAGRYRLNRMRPAFESLPNLDLLPLARRLWRRRVGSCALGNLEREVLGVRRSSADVPGWAIPGIYTDYLRTGDARQLARVMYHNLIDVLSMVTLAARLLAVFESPRAREARPLPPQDRLSLARWYEALGMIDEATDAYRAALDDDLPEDDARRAFEWLGVLLRRAERRAEAVAQWERWAARFPDDPAPRVEIAKHYEWRDKDSEQAHAWATAALEALERWPLSAARAALRREITHRLARLEKKISKA